MRLFLIRHGETGWNTQEIFRGHADIPLNENGFEQARKTAAALQPLPIAAVYSSPLSRAVETARLIAEPHGHEVIIEEGFIDFNYGIWQGRPHEEVKKKYPELYHLWLTAPHKVRFEQGEALADVRTRALAALEKILARHKGENVVVVTHRVVCKVLLCVLLGLDESHFWRIRQDTCAINVLEYSDDHGYIVSKLNDTCHLRPLSEVMKTGDF